VILPLIKDFEFMGPGAWTTDWRPFPPNFQGGEVVVVCEHQAGSTYYVQLETTRDKALATCLGPRFAVLAPGKTGAVLQSGSEPLIRVSLSAGLTRSKLSVWLTSKSA
jgi:hypothetical protein